MPKLVGKNIVRFDANDFLAGLYEQYQTSISANPGYINNGLLVSSNFNPYRALGYAAPGFNPTDLTTVSVMTGLGRNITTASESSVEYGYILCANDRLNRLVLSTNTFSNAGSWPHTIAGGAASEEGDDCITYDIGVASVRTQAVLYSWNDVGSTTWNIGIFNTSAGTFDDDWLTTVPLEPDGTNYATSGSTKPHPMIVGADDVLYIGDGNKLHGYDGAVGATGTFYDSVLTLPSSFIIKAFAKLSNYLVIFGYYSPTGNVYATPSGATRSAAFFYDYISQDPTYNIPITGGAVTAAFEYNSTVGCFTQGTPPIQNGSEDRNGSIRIWNGSEFELKRQFIGNAPAKGGVDVVGNSIQWNSDGIIHCYGAPLLGAPDGLNKLATGGGTSLGFLRTVGSVSGYQVMSSGTTTSGGAQYIKVSTFAPSASIQTSTFAPVLEPGTIARVVNVGITFSTTASAGRAMSAYLVKDNGQTSQFITDIATITNATLSSNYMESVSGADFGTFRELSLSLQWSANAGETSAPIVRNVDVEFEITNLKN